MVDSNENNPLNDAVEQIDTSDENVGQQQGQQNQQSTIATTIATGAETADAADEINEALNANPSAAGGNEQESEQTAVQGEGTESTNTETPPESSNVIEGDAANTPSQGTEAPEQNSVGAGAQSVGGDTTQSGSAGGQSAQGQTEPINQTNGAAPSASTQAEPSTQTSSEEFEVNVLDQQPLAQSQQDDSFDSRTTESTFEVQIDNVNDAAVVEGMEYTVLEDGLLSFTAADLLASASDIDGDSLSISDVSYGGTDGVLTNLGGGTYTFAPNENFNGSISLSYGVSDGTVVTDSTIDVVVESVNDLPVFGTASYTVDEDNTLIFNEDQLLSSASDVEGDVSLVGVSYDGTDGIFTVNNDGTCSFSPNENFNGTVTLDIVIEDEDGAQVAATFDVNVLAVNDAPVSGDIAYTLDEDGNITLSQNQLLSQASDVDGDDLTASNVTVAGNATVLDNQDGSFTITPDADFNGNIDVSFDISDDDATVQATGGLTVNPVNDLPTTDTVTASVDEDNSIIVNQAQLLANAADIEGDALTADNLSATNATIADNGDGTFTITPDANFNGLIDVSYDISDGSTPVAGNLALTVDPVNDAPIISADVPITIEEDGSYTVTQQELLQFATDIEDDDMTAIIGEQGEATTVSGTVLNAEDGQPVVGADVTLSDAVGNSQTVQTDAQGQYTVSGSVFEQGSITIEQEGAITNSFLVPAGETTDSGVISLSEVLDSTDMRIVVTWGASPRDMDNHLWLYDTDTGAELDHIFYQDMSHNLSGGTVQQDVDDTNGHGPETITIPNYQDANMHYSVHNYTNRSWDVDGVEDVQVQVFVGDTLVQTFAPELPENISGDHWHVFDVVDGIVVPSQEVGGQTAFTLPTSEEAANAENGVDIAALFDVDEGTDGGGGTDVSDNVTIGDINMPNGVITDNGDGTYTITPDENFNGEFEINYTVDDGNGGVSPAQLDVTVTAVNDAAVIYDQSYSMDEDGTLTITDAELLVGATDIDGDILSVAGVHYEGTDGVLTSHGDGTHTFTPNENFNGALNLSFDVTDGTELSTGNIDIAVTAVDDAPIVSGPLSYSVDEDGAITLSQAQLLANSTDVDGDALTASVDSALNATVTANENGSYTLTPDADFSGEITFNMNVSDGQTIVASDIALTVDAVADAPTLTITDGDGQAIGADGIVIDPDDTIELNISGAVTDLDGSEMLSVSASGIPEGSVIRYDSDTVLNDQSNGLTSYVDSEITVTFEGEGAGYLNTVGYYKVDENGQIQDVEVVYENASQLGGGGELIPGQSSFSFDLEQGESFNLFVIPNGFNHNDFNALGEGQFEFRDTDGNQATTSSTDPQLVFVNANGDETMIQSQNGDAVFHGGTSPNLNQDGIDHTRTYFNENDELVYGIEDMYNGGDRDYDDFLFTIDLGEVNSSIYQGEVTVDTSEAIILPTVALLEPISIDLPVDYSGEFDIQIDATSTELSNNDAETTSQSIHVDAREHAPESTPIFSSVDEDGSVVVTQEMLLENATDLNGDILTASNVQSNDPNASVVDNNDGTYTITPSDNFNGDLALTYSISDGEFSTENTLNLSVNAVNDAPTSENVELVGTEDESILISQEDLLVHAVDIEDDDLTANDLQIDPSFGDLIDNQNGTWTFTPAENLNGDVPFTFKVDDGVDATQVSGNINLAEVNDAPDAPTVTYSTDEDQVLVVDPAFILSQASDIDNDSLSLESLTVRSPENATLQQQPDGLYHLVTSQDFNGLVELDYIVSDGELSAQGSVNVDVIPVNDEPFTVGNAFLTTNEDDAFTFDTSDMLDLFGDIDTTELVISRVIVADNEDGGSVTDNGDGTWTFTPTSDFAGLSELQVIASDGEFETALDVPVYVRPVADGAVITTAHDGPLVFDEDTTGYLNLDVNLIDDSEQLSNLVMTGYPVGFTLSDGSNVIDITEEGQLINITNWDIDNLQMTPPDDFHGNFFVTVTATTVDYGDESNDQPEQPVGGDFNVVSGEALIISHDDLIAMAQNVEAEQGDDVQLVHLVDPSQGSLIDNDDGTWTFSPAPGFSGNVDLAYVIEKEGILYDEQSDIGVFDSSESLTSSPTIDAIANTDINESEPLTFTDDDMLATISSEDNHDLSIESVSLLAGEGLIESNGQGNYQFTPAEGYTGQAQVGFVASDGENSVQSHFNIGVDNEVAVSQTLAQADDGSIEISGANVLANLGLDDSTLIDLDYTGDQGALISNGNDMWTFWPDDGFEGNIDLSAGVVDSAGAEQAYTTSLTVETEEAQVQPVDTQSASVSDEVDSSIESSVDITAAPGDEVEISAPDEVTSVDGVDYITVTNLPEGAEINGALSDGEGGYTISGDLSQSVTLVLDDQYEGSANLSFQGFDDLDAPVEGATATLDLDIDEQYSMQASSQQNQDTSSLQQANGGDWTQSDNTQVDVDFTDDTGSFGTDDNSGTSTQSDVDDNLV